MTQFYVGSSKHIRSVQLYILDVFWVLDVLSAEVKFKEGRY